MSLVVCFVSFLVVFLYYFLLLFCADGGGGVLVCGLCVRVDSLRA